MKKIIALLSAVSIIGTSSALPITSHALVPESFGSYTYNDSNELVFALENDLDETFLAEFEKQQPNESSSKIVDLIGNANYYGVYVLSLDEQELNANGVHLFLNDLYNNVNVYYTSEIEKTGIQYVQWMYIGNSYDCSTMELMEKINPNDSDDFYPAYSVTEEKDLVIGETEYDCVVGKFEDDPRSYITFVYDGALFRIVGNDDLMDSYGSLNKLKIEKKKCTINTNFLIEYGEKTKNSAVLGDLDSDGFVDSADALLVLRMSVGLQPSTPESKAAADIDSNSQIDSSDALAILRHSVGIGVNDRIGKTIIDVTDK